MLPVALSNQTSGTSLDRAISATQITVIHLAVRRSESGALRQIPRGFGRRRQLQANAVPAANEWISGAEGFRPSTGRLRPSLEISHRGARCAQFQDVQARPAPRQIGRAHVCTPVTNAHLVCRLLLDKKKQQYPIQY